MTNSTHSGHYERVTFRAEGAARSKTVILADPVCTGHLLTGVEVDDQGDEVAPRGADERRHIISCELVTKRTQLRMNNIYGTLEVAQ